MWGIFCLISQDAYDCKIKKTCVVYWIYFLV